MEEIRIITYKTIDGKLFDVKEDAEKHEKTLTKVKAYKIYAYPDLTEGRHGAKFQGYLLVHADNNQDLFVEDWCYRKYKNKIGFIMGAYGSNAIMETWLYHEVPLASVNLNENKILDKIEENFVNKIWS